VNRAGLAGLIALCGALSSYGDTGVQHVTGNGRITVALDGAGVLTHFSWPGPGAGQHLGASGAHWVIGSLERPERFHTNGWRIEQEYLAPDSLVLVTRYSEVGGERSAEQIIAVVPGTDLVLVLLRLHGFAPDTPCFWAQSVEPLDLRPRGFASFQPEVRRLNRGVSLFEARPGILEHFRPAHAGRDYVNAARDWMARGTDVDFGPGVYIGAKTLHEAHGLEWDSTSSPEEAAPGRPRPVSRRAWGVETGVTEVAGTASEATRDFAVLLGASDTREGLRAAFTEGLKRSVEELIASPSELSGYWAGAPETVTRTDPAAIRARLNLSLCLDPTSGAAVRAPALSGAATLCDVVDTAWASAALDALGRHDDAARALAVHVETIRTERGTDTPAGSLPRAIYRDGTSASPWGNADPAGAAWLLAACWRHMVSLPADGQRDYLQAVWPALSLSADYLAREPRVGGALSGALPAEAAPLDTLRVQYLGLESGRRMAAVLEVAEPELWSDRREEIYSRIRFRKLNQAGLGEGGEPWIDWWLNTLPGATSDGLGAWEVLRTEGATALTASAILDWVVESGLGPEAPFLRRDALRCLLVAGAAEAP